MKTQEPNSGHSNEVIKKIQGHLEVEEILAELHISNNDNMYITEQEVGKVTNENPILILSGMGECSCDIYKSVATGEIYISHTMSPYENVSLNKLRTHLIDAQNVVVIGTSDTDSDTYNNTSDTLTKFASDVKISKITKVELDTEGYSYSLILNFKNNSVICVYFDEDSNQTILKTVKLNF
jgi:hypothetical protein